VNRGLLAQFSYSPCAIEFNGTGDRPFLGAFAKLRKATVSFLMTVSPSVHMEQLGSHRTDFYDIQEFLEKYIEKIQVSLKYDKQNGYFT